MDKSGIKVRIFDIENGLREYKDIKIIRIISKDYNLLIMKDYLPIIGEIEGSVDKRDSMNNIFYFAFVGIIVVVSLYIILKILIKKFNPEESKVKLYGILQGMSNKEIISISCSIISYVFMIYLMASFIDLDIYIAIIVLFLTLVSGILIKNKKVIIDLILSAISLVGIKVVYLIHDYIINEYMDMWMLLLLVFVMLFLFLYLSYTLLKNIKNVVIANKYIRKGGNHEDKERS